MSRLKMSCVSGVRRHISLCLILVEVFAILGEPCYQILKMLSSLPRLPTRAGDMSSSPLYHLSLCSLFFNSFQMSESSSNLPFFSLALPPPLFPHVDIVYIIETLFHYILTCCICYFKDGGLQFPSSNNTILSC